MANDDDSHHVHRRKTHSHTHTATCSSHHDHFHHDHAHNDHSHDHEHHADHEHHKHSDSRGHAHEGSEDEICALNHVCDEKGHRHDDYKLCCQKHECQAQQGCDAQKSHQYHNHDHNHDHSHSHSHSHSHGHDCGHDHGSGIWAYLPHSHGLHERINADRASLKIACVILTVSLTVQIGGGLLVDSSVLEAEAVHTALDGLVLVCSFLSIVLASKKTTSKYTYGYGRAEILSALVSVLTLVLMCVQLGGSAVKKLWFFSTTEHVVSGKKGLAVTVAEALTLTNNILIALVLAKNNSLNMRALRAHVIGDSIGNIVVLSAGAVMWKYPHLSILDPLLTLIVVIAICAMNVPLAKETIEVLMQASPFNSRKIRESILSLPGVKRVRDLHIWTLTSGANIASVKVESDSSNSHGHNDGVSQLLEMQKNIESHLFKEGVHQCTVQVNEYQPDSDDDSEGNQGTVFENTGMSRVQDDNRYRLVDGTDDEMV